MTNDPLAGLRGYHLPEPVTWWPPAPGWWLLTGLALIGVALLLYGAYRYRRRGALARQARAELAALQAAFERERDPVALARGLSRLLRRFALARFPRQEVAGLTGEAWLAFLDTHGGEGRFRDGPGRVLIDAPYRLAATVPADALTALAGDWIRRNAKGRAP
jgi:hypothetical protein